MDRDIWCSYKTGAYQRFRNLEAYQGVLTSFYESLPKRCDLESYQAFQPSITPR